MRSNLTLHLPSQARPSTPYARALEHPLRAARDEPGGQHRSEGLMHPIRAHHSSTDGPGRQDAARKAAKAAPQAFGQDGGPGADIHCPRPALCGDSWDQLRMSGRMLNLSAQKEVERMLAEARGHAAAIEQSRRHLQSTLNMVLDLIHLEAGRRGPSGHVPPD